MFPVTVIGRWQALRRDSIRPGIGLAKQGSVFDYLCMNFLQRRVIC
jgi:hypothetical protein